MRGPLPRAAAPPALRFRRRCTVAGQAGGPCPGLLSRCPFGAPAVGRVFRSLSGRWAGENARRRSSKTALTMRTFSRSPSAGVPGWVATPLIRQRLPSIETRVASAAPPPAIPATQNARVETNMPSVFMILMDHFCVPAGGGLSNMLHRLQPARYCVLMSRLAASEFLTFRLAASHSIGPSTRLATLPRRQVSVRGPA